MEVMEVLLFLGLWMSATGLFLQAGSQHSEHRACPSDSHLNDLLPLFDTNSCLSAIQDSSALQTRSAYYTLNLYWKALPYWRMDIMEYKLCEMTVHFGTWCFLCGQNADITCSLNSQHILNQLRTSPVIANVTGYSTFPISPYKSMINMINACSMITSTAHKLIGRCCSNGIETFLTKSLHLYNTYIANDANHGQGVCTTHHKVPSPIAPDNTGKIRSLGRIWEHLHNVHHTGELQLCLNNLITQLFPGKDLEMSDAYEHYGGCNCATVQTTITAAPAMTTTIRLASDLALPCNKYATITSLAYGIQFHHPLATSCGTTSDHQGSDALVFNLCQTKNDTSQWKGGPNVMSNCPNIPLYTPIATFINGAYSSNGGLSGIFVGCLPDGFKIAVQECGSNSTILNLVRGGIMTHDPNAYFVVRE